MNAGQRLTMAEVPTFIEQARAAIRSGNRRIELGGLTAVDSAALAALIELRRDPAGAQTEFVDPPDNLRKLASLYGLDDLLFPA